MSDYTIERFRELYEQADSFSREVTEFRSEVSIPAHNQLRYAGHHFLQALNDDGAIVDDDALRKAINHCERAMYEASEAGLVELMDELKLFRRIYQGITIRDLVPEYHQLVTKAEKARQRLIAGRGDRQSVTQHVGAYMETFRDLRTGLIALDVARDDLDARREEQIFGRQHYVGFP